MKLALVCLLAIATIVYVSARPDGYTTKYDNIDVDQILNNDRLLKRYVDCLMDRISNGCPAEAIELKKVVRDALETECSKCSDAQKRLMRKVVKFLAQNKRDIWDDLKSKYDPEGQFSQKYEEMAREQGVDI